MATNKTPSEGSEGGQTRLERHLEALRKRHLKRQTELEAVSPSPFAPRQKRTKSTDSPKALPKPRKPPAREARDPSMPVDAAGKVKWLGVQWYDPAKGFDFGEHGQKPLKVKGNVPLESTVPRGGKIGSAEIFGGIDEGFLNDAIAAVLTSLGVPKSQHRETWAEMERIARARADAARRPKWDERGKYAELKDLSAPQFLKRVYADAITSDGSRVQQMVRDIAPKLMASVEVYLSNRKSRQKDLGDAAGLRLIAGPTSPLKRSDLG